MNYIFSHHAQQRMKQRHIDKESVLLTLESPDDVWIGDNGEEISVRNFGTYTVRVVYEKREPAICVYNHSHPQQIRRIKE